MQRLLFALFVAWAPVLVFAGEAERPNIVFILADDVGPGDIGLLHRERTGREPVAPTPHLDTLALAGVRFTDAHSSTALCSPSRYCAMSGNLCHRSYAPWGVWKSFKPTPFKPGDATVGRIGQNAGLRTGFIGKWHLGGDFSRADGKRIFRGDDHGSRPEKVDLTRMVGGGPESIGFDYSYVLPTGIQGPIYAALENGRWSPFEKSSELVYFDDADYTSDKGPGVGDSAWRTEQIGPLLADKAEVFLRGAAKANQPFLLCYWSPMVHLPHLPPEEFDGRPIRGETPSHHLDAMLDLDQQVGRIVSVLKETGAYDNTLIVFTSDNGGLADRQGRAAGHDSSGGWRGFKNSAYEGGHRVPFFAVWPDRIRPGSTDDTPVAAHDVVATLAAALGQSLGERQAMDSLDLMPLLTGEGEVATREDFLLQGGSRHELIYRRGPWKLIVQSDRKVTRFEPAALFNLEENPREKEKGNLIDAPEHRQRVADMLKRYRELRESGQRTAPHSRLSNASL